MNQDDVRQRVHKYITERGVKWKHINKAIGLPDSVMSAYQHGKIELYPESLTKLDAFLKAEGY